MSSSPEPGDGSTAPGVGSTPPTGSEQSPTPGGISPPAMTGGGGDGSPVPSAEAGSPAPGTYGTRSPLLDANSEMAVAELDGKIYVIGGYPSTRVVQSTVQVYDTVLDSWELGPALPLPTHHPVAVGTAGKVYSLGGQLEGDVNGGRSFALDPNVGAWEELAPMPTPRGAGAAAVIGDLIYVAGGRPPAGNAFEAYDLVNDTWLVMPNLPLAFNDRNHLSVVAIGGKVYVAGGRFDGGNVGSPLTDSLDIFDPASNEWTSGAPMLRPRGGVNGVAALGCFHVWGGEGANIGEPNNVFPDHDVYDPVANSWTALAPLPAPVHGVTGAAFVNGLIYIPGGGTASGGNSGSVIHQVFRPEGGCN